MFDRVRQKLNQGGTFGTGVVVAVVLAAVFVAILLFRHNMGPSSAAMHAAGQVYICKETGRTFTHTLKAGETYPLLSPHSGKKTAYPADVCWWTKDGKLKNEPTYLLRNRYRGETGPTFCPECDRLWSPEAPAPTADMKPPITKQEYQKRNSGGAPGAEQGEL